MDENLVADPGPRANYQVLKNKYGGWKYPDFEAAIKKAQRPSELDDLRIAAKYFLSTEDAMKADEANHQRLNELSDRLISFGDFMRAYKNAQSGFMAMRDRCVKAGNNWVCASYMAQVEFFINSQAKDTSTGGRGPLNDMLGKVREGYEIVKVLEQKWKEYKDRGEKEIPGFEEEEIKDIFKGFLAKEIGQERFWESMDIRSEVEGKPIITPAKKNELIDLWAHHGILLPAQKHITKPEVTMPKPPAAPMEPIRMEEVRQVIKKESDLDKRIDELRKKKEKEKEREEREQKEWQKLPKPEVRPEPPPKVPEPSEQPKRSAGLDLMEDEIRKRIAEIKRRRSMGEGQAGEPRATYGTPEKKRDRILEVTGSESRYSAGGYIKTPVSVIIEKDPYAKYLLYQRGAGKEVSTSYHTKTFTNIYVLRYQGAFGYTIEMGFTDEKNNAIKALFDPAPGNIINGLIFENERKIAEFDVDEASFRKAEQFSRENKVIKETRSTYPTSASCPRCGTRLPAKPGGSSCPKCGTFVPERMEYEPKILPTQSYAFAEMEFRIKTCQDVETLKKVHAKLDTTEEFTEFDKEMLKEEMAQRMQTILEHEEAHKPGAGEKFAEGAAAYTQSGASIRHRPLVQVLGMPGPLYHAQIFYQDGTNSGFFEDSKIRSDDPGMIKNYKVYRGNMDNTILHLAEDNTKRNWDLKYNLITHNCQHYANAVEKEYDRLTGLNIKEPDILGEQKRLDNNYAPKTDTERDKKKDKTPLELAREERLKQYPTEEAFRTAKTKYADFLASDFHLKSHKDKAEQYKPGSIQYNKHMVVYNERLKEIADLRKEAAAGKTILEMRYEEVEREGKEYEAEIEAHERKLKALRTESYEALLAKAKSFNSIWGDESKPWKERYKGKDEVKDIISVLKERNIDIITILNAQLHELESKNKNKIRETGLEYTIKETDDEIIQQIKNEQGNLKGLKCTTIKSFHKSGYTVVVMKPYQEGEGLGSMGSTSLYDLNFKEESSAKRLEAKLKLLFESGSAVACNTSYDNKVSETNLKYLVGDAYKIEDIEGIKKAALSGTKTVWVNHQGREGLILASKYGKDWWEKATRCDIERIAVYESGAGYSAQKPEHVTSDKLSIVESNLLNVGYDLRNDGRGHMVLPNGKGVSPTNHRGIVNHWEVIVDAGYLPSSNIFKLKHSPDMIVAGAINKGWRRWSGEASYEIRDLSKSNADFINKRLKYHFDNSGLHDAHIDVWSEGKYYNFDKKMWDSSNHDILQVVKKVTHKSYHPAEAIELKLIENEYLIRDPASIGDPDTWIKSKGVAFQDDIHGAHHGQVDGTLRAYDIKTSLVIGYIDYSIFEGKIYINGIEVDPTKIDGKWKYRRQGFATALVLKLKALNPDTPVKWGMMTDEGCALKNAVDKESPDTPSGVKVYYKGVLGERKPDDAQDLFKDQKENCKEWDFGTFESLLPGMEREDLDEMMDCVTSSTKLADTEIEILRKLIEKKMEE